MLQLSDADSRFVFIWEEDVANCLLYSLDVPLEKAGVYNLTGDGTLDIPQMAALMKKRCLHLPAGLFVSLVQGINKLGFFPINAEQIPFVRYRPVPINTKMKEVLGFVPAKSTEEVFGVWIRIF